MNSLHNEEIARKRFEGGVERIKRRAADNVVTDVLAGSRILYEQLYDDDGRDTFVPFIHEPLREFTEADIIYRHILARSQIRFPRQAEEIIKAMRSESAKRRARAKVASTVGRAALAH